LDELKKTQGKKPLKTQGKNSKLKLKPEKFGTFPYIFGHFSVKSKSFMRKA